MEADEVMRFQRQERMDLVAAVEPRAEVLPAALVPAAVPEPWSCATARLCSMA